MLPLHLVFAIGQTAAASVSASILLWTRPKKHAIKLPIFAGEGLDGLNGRDSAVEELPGGDKDDPFDVSTPLDFVDGIPIDEDNFWSKACAQTLHALFHAHKAPRSGSRNLSLR